MFQIFLLKEAKYSCVCMCMVYAWRPEDVCPALPFCFYSFESGPLTEAGAAPVILLSPPPSVLSLQVHITMPDFLCGC